MTLSAQNNPLKKILFVSHKEKLCGVHEYGLSVVEALQKSTEYSFIYAECSNPEEFSTAVYKVAPAAIIYNYYASTLPWLEKAQMDKFDIPHLGIMHEVTQQVADTADTDFFDYHIAPDPTLLSNNPIVFKTGRLIPAYTNTFKPPRITTIGSLGFATAGKGFERLIIAVQEEFDEAVIRLHIPPGDFAPFDTEMIQRCRKLIVKQGIKLVTSHEFLEKRQLLDFLAQNTLNAFFYDSCEGRGISSVIENALAVRRPIAITRSSMFRHVLCNNESSANPPVCIERAPDPVLSLKERLYLKLKSYKYVGYGGNGFPLNWFLRPEISLRQIIANGFEPLLPICSDWSEPNLILDYERILQHVLHS